MRFLRFLPFCRFAVLPFCRGLKGRVWAAFGEAGRARRGVKVVFFRLLPIRARFCRWHDDAFGCRCKP